jgi:hypothetical protein
MMGTQNKAVVVLIHGIGAKKDCWSQFLSLLRADVPMVERFEFEAYIYHTGKINLGFLRSIPSVEVVAEDLKTFLQETRFADREITLVGHSQGGLVILAYLDYMVKHGLGRQLAPIRQVITLATPFLGSTTLSGLRKFASIFGENAQERYLRVFDANTAEIVRTVKNCVAETQKADDNNWPIPVHCFYGDSDAVVTKASACGPFKSFDALPADHESIILPKNREDQIYCAFTQLLLKSPSKETEFEIDSYETTLMVCPVASDVPQVVQHGLIYSHEVRTDNVAELVRVIRFSASNRHVAPFDIIYSTLGDGFVKFWSKGLNEASSEAMIDYERNGKMCLYRFTPNVSSKPQEYKCKVTIYKGFDRNNRDIHFHLGRDRYYHKITFYLDLRPYISAGYVVTKVPEFRFSECDFGVCDSRCKDKFELVDDWTPTDTGSPGLWRWDFAEVRQGMTYLSWDVDLPPAGPKVPDSLVAS